MMVEIKQDNLADAMGFSYAGFGDDAVSFFDKFRRSGFMKRFERGDGRATLGCSGCELALMINNRLGGRYQSAGFDDKCDFNTITAPTEYWIGYALGYLQGRSGLSFSEIFDQFPLEGWYGMYNMHEISDEALWNKTLGRYPEYKFGGREHPFSNYFPAPATYEGISFSNSEAAFQSAKTLDLDARKAFIGVDPGKAKGDGRRLKLRSDWEQTKYQVMLDVLRSKFSAPELGKMLIETGDRLLIEDTTGWHDNEWGDCGCAKCAGIAGKNLLGNALMEVRSELKRSLRENR
jgi:ribA/ribD-fused uncharacterized protein